MKRARQTHRRRTRAQKMTTTRPVPVEVLSDICATLADLAEWSRAAMKARRHDFCEPVLYKADVVTLASVWCRLTSVLATAIKLSDTLTLTSSYTGAFSSPAVRDAVVAMCQCMGTGVALPVYPTRAAEAEEARRRLTALCLALPALCPHVAPRMAADDRIVRVELSWMQGIVSRSSYAPFAGDVEVSRLYAELAAACMQATAAVQQYSPAASAAVVPAAVHRLLSRGPVSRSMSPLKDAAMPDEDDEDADEDAVDCM